MTGIVVFQVITDPAMPGGGVLLCRDVAGHWVAACARPLDLRWVPRIVRTILRAPHGRTP